MEALKSFVPIVMSMLGIVMTFTAVNYAVHRKSQRYSLKSNLAVIAAFGGLVLMALGLMISDTLAKMTRFSEFGQFYANLEYINGTALIVYVLAAYFSAKAIWGSLGKINRSNAKTAFQKGGSK